MIALISLSRQDTVRIYVLEDPGIPNNAVILKDEYYQRCVPTTAISVHPKHRQPSQQRCIGLSWILARRWPTLVQLTFRVLVSKLTCRVLILKLIC